MMRPLTLCLALAALVALVSLADRAEAGGRTRTRNDMKALYHANQSSWHGPYYHREYGMPLALVVPPTASMQTQWSWGVAQTRVVDIHHQFGRAYPIAVEYGAAPLYPTPAWPSHTDQFGVYPVRGPW